MQSNPKLESARTRIVMERLRKQKKRTTLGALAVFACGLYILPALHVAFHNLPHTHVGNLIQLLEPEQLTEVLHRDSAARDANRHQLIHLAGIPHRDEVPSNSGDGHSTPAREQAPPAHDSSHGARSAAHFSALIAGSPATVSPSLAMVEQSGTLRPVVVVLHAEQISFDTPHLRGPPAA